MRGDDELNVWEQFGEPRADGALPFGMEVVIAAANVPAPESVALALALQPTVNTKGDADNGVLGAVVMVALSPRCESIIAV